MGIENSIIEGYYCGSIAGKSTGSSAAILNCYSNVTINGYNAGGIAENFSNGVIVCSYSTSEINGTVTGGILSSGGDVKLYSCFTTSPVVAPSDVINTTSYALPLEVMQTTDFVTKYNIKVGIAQSMFANASNVALLQWELDDTNRLYYNNQDGWICFFNIINYYLLPAILALFVIHYAIRFFHTGREKIWLTYHKQIFGALIIFGVISIFMDTALLAKGTGLLNWGNTTFILLANFIFCVCFFLIVKNFNWKSLIPTKECIPLFIIIILAVILELFQFNLVPKYDACLYYGSFMNGAQLFRLDLLTYVGGFVCWKWAQGLALLLAPIEFLLPGQMISIYIANIIITVVTLCCFYWLLRQIFIQLSPVGAALSCSLFLFLPYSLGMFTYLCMDWHLAFFSIWLMCSAKKKNNGLIAFCGYLLSFTKITGLVFYVIFLLSIAIREVILDKGTPFFKRILHWWSFKKVLLWVSPAVMFLVTFVYGDFLTIQNFYGSYTPEKIIQLKPVSSLTNTMLQSFVWGFRWVFIVLFIICLITALCKNRRLNHFMTKDGITLFAAAALAACGIFTLLCLYNSDADCPRYTAIFNLMYAMSAPLFFSILYKKEFWKTLSIASLALIMLVQTYWTIDPSITLYAKSIDTGKKQIYKLADRSDGRAGMNLGIYYGPGLEVICDLYTYNIEHTFYDDLLDAALTEMEPSADDTFFVLDITDYELHLSGSFWRNYKIYWNTRLKKRTYDKWDEDSVYLDVNSITTTEITSVATGGLWFPDTFYLIVVDRVDASDFLNRLKEDGYQISKESHPENIYGAMSIYQIRK